MEFCDECGSMLKTEGDTWVCASCGFEKDRDTGSEDEMVTTAGQEESEVVDVSDTDANEGRPTTSAQCPQCDNDRAYWYMQQIRAADESETRFLVCTECEHKWREDDH